MKRVLLAGLCSSLALIAPMRSEAKINKFASVSEGIFRGSQPEERADYENLKRLGVRTLLNLQNAKTSIDSERQFAAELGFNYVSIPIDGFWGAAESSFNEAVAVLSDPSAQPVFVHCQLGQDRTGVVVGLYRIMEQSWTPKTAYQEMRSFGYDFLLLGLDYDFWHRVKELGFDEEELAEAKTR